MKYVFENGYDIEIFGNEEKAIENSEYFWNLMTESEKDTVEYFRVYEIEDCNTYDYADLTDVMTRMVKDFLK